MAFPPHIQLALRMFPHLIEAAKTGQRTSYEELGTKLRMESRLFSKPLAFIRDEICASHGLPPLTAIVENKGGDRPVNSFSPPHLASLNKVEYEKVKKAAIDKVYTYPKWDIALNGVQTLYCVI